MPGQETLFVDYHEAFPKKCSNTKPEHMGSVVVHSRPTEVTVGWGPRTRFASHSSAQPGFRTNYTTNKPDHSPGLRISPGLILWFCESEVHVICLTVNCYSNLFSELRWLTVFALSPCLKSHLPTVLFLLTNFLEPVLITPFCFKMNLEARPGRGFWVLE